MRFVGTPTSSVALPKYCIPHPPRRRLKLRYKDTLKKIPTQNVTLKKNSVKSWPQTGLDGGMLFAREQTLIKNARQSSQQVKRAAMKARTITAESSTECPVCSRLCAPVSQLLVFNAPPTGTVISRRCVHQTLA